VDNLLGRAEIPAAARSRILEAAEGNPLFVEEMLGMLIDDGLLRLEDGTWRAVDDLADLTVPPTIQLLLAARIDRLDAEERAVMERGAVEGKVFHGGAVAALAPEALRPRVPGRLLALARKELIRPDRAEFSGEDAFRFRHLLIRDAAYQAMPKEQRADLHERFAGWLEAMAGGRVAEYEEILAHHLEQAYRYRLELGPPDERARELAGRARARLRSSADRAQQRGDSAAARHLLERTVDLLSEGSERARTLVELAFTVAGSNDYQAAVGLADEAIAGAEAAGDRIALLRARLVRAEATAQIDPGKGLRQTQREIGDLVRELEEAGDERGTVWALLAASRSAFYDGRCDRAVELIDRVIARGPALSARESHEVATTLLIAGYFGTSNPEDLEGIGDRIRRVFTVVGPLTEVILALNVLGQLVLRGREAEALAEIERIDRLWSEISGPAQLATYQVIGEALQLFGRPEEAERRYRIGVEELDRLGETGFNSTLTAALGHACCDLRRWDEAEALARRARALSSSDDVSAQLEWRAVLTRVLTFRGRAEEALVLADEAVELIEPTDYLVMSATAHERRAEVLAALDRIEEARAAFEQALMRFERKGSVPDVTRVRERLAGLGR
jgi:tetratricopeptide (TPR) repeat protein